MHFWQKDDVREHSRLLDRALGLEVEQIEQDLLDRARKISPQGSVETWGAKLHQGNQTWVGLDPQTLQTPYSELWEICEKLSPAGPSTFVDLGAGYGRLGILLHHLQKGHRFLGYEYLAERVQEGRRVFSNLGIETSELIQQDLTDANFTLPEADYYFIYDYGKVAHIRHTLKQVEDMVGRKKFKVIARGKGVRSLIENEHPWLSQVHSPLHETNYSIYSMSL